MLPTTIDKMFAGLRCSNDVHIGSYSDAIVIPPTIR
jgi:hypothetical protein